MNLVPLRHDSESQQLYGERRKQLHAYGLGKPQKGKWGTTAQLMERRSIFGDPSRVPPRHRAVGMSGRGSLASALPWPLAGCNWQGGGTRQSSMEPLVPGLC